MPNPYFRFKQFTVFHDRCAMKVTTDACLFGAWCAEAIKKEKFKIKNCLDIGTGSGLLSLMIAQETDVQIDAVEINKDAAEQAKENVEHSPFKNIEIFNQDILGFNPQKQYDAIVCNPPFYEDELQSADVLKNQAHHSSNLRFAELLIKINELLLDNGSFFLLLPFKRRDEIQDHLQQHSFFIWEEVSVKQTENHSPFRWLIQGKKFPVDVAQKGEVIIKKNSAYSVEFVDLLKEYYLYL